MMKRCVLAVVLVAIGCHSEKTGVVAGPPLTIAAQDVAPAASSAADVPPSSPVSARFVDLAPASRESLKIAPCEAYFVAVARGNAIAAGETLGPNDVLFAQGAGAFDVTGVGLTLVASVHSATCDAASSAPFAKRVVRASAAPDLAFAGGKMHAHLDIEAPVSPLAYFGRLEGTAPVPEHTHDGAWEILCAVEGSGTASIDGKPRHVGPKTITFIPPATRHSWTPDPGSSLVAFQMYTPPGPEQRFRKLAESPK